MIHNHLNWKKQVNTICKRLNSTIALLKRINYYLCPEMKIMFYNSYFMSISNYCCFIWGKEKDCSHKITLIQKRATRIILNKPGMFMLLTLMEEISEHLHAVCYRSGTFPWCNLVRYRLVIDCCLYSNERRDRCVTVQAWQH